MRFWTQVPPLCSQPRLRAHKINAQGLENIYIVPFSVNMLIRCGGQCTHGFSCLLPAERRWSSAASCMRWGGQTGYVLDEWSSSGSKRFLSSIYWCRCPSAEPSSLPWSSCHATQWHTVTHLDTLLHCTSVEEVQDWADFILLRDWRTGAYTAPSSSDLSKHIKVWFLYDISFSFFNSRMVWFLFCFLRWHITQIFCFFNNNSTHDFWPVCLVRLGSPAGGPGCELT